ncbi:MAG: methionyl-tRNA formyltransferase [Desulfovibrio sp.]|nr:methionyl-tRNA formyltransferase [Desulfovibrio sp.]
MRTESVSIKADSPSLRAVFMGTPDFAAAILNLLLHEECLDITAVYTQPDRPAGRGKNMRPSPVKTLAEERGIAVEQPPDFKHGGPGDAAVAALAAYAPDVLLVAAYGLILPQRVLDIPKLMPINVHASLLPKHRGAAPIQRAIMQGDVVTGVSIMRMEAGLDSGPILLQRATGIGINDTAAMLREELAEEGARLLLMSLRRLMAGTLCEIPQEHARATYAPKLRKEDGLLDLSLHGEMLHAHIRGATPWPGASIILHRDGQPELAVQVEPGVFPLTDGMQQALATHNEKKAQESLSIARVVGQVDGALLLDCGGGYAFTSFRPAGRKSMHAAAFYNGYIAGAGGVYFSGR